MSKINPAIVKADDFFKINEADKLLVKGAKAAGRGIAQSVLLVAAAVETVFAAVITAAFSPLSFIFKDKFASLKGYTASSAEAVVNAGKSIAGALKKEEKKVEAKVEIAEMVITPGAEEAAKSNTEKFVEIATSKYAKGAAALVAIAGLGYASYVYGPAAYAKAGEYYVSARDTVVPFAKEQMAIISDKLSAGYESAKGYANTAYESTKGYADSAYHTVKSYIPFIKKA